MNPKRLELIQQTAHRRQGNLTVIIENIQDPHNIGAILRSCDSVGIHELFLLFTEDSLQQKEFTIGKRSSAGARKWVDAHVYSDSKACFEHVKSKYDKVLSTHLSTDASSLYDLDLCQSTALMFGNERDGLSDEALAYSDGNFIIPQMGMSKSLNLSVACAVTLFEAFRQRNEKGMYEENNPMTEEQQKAMFEDYANRKKIVYADSRTHTYQLKF